MSEIRKTTSERRKLSTSWKVALSDKIARQVITIGGLATIGSVLLVVIVLVSSVLPLLTPTTLSSQSKIISADDTAANSFVAIHSGVDEFVEQAWFLDSSGDVLVRSVADNQVLAIIKNESTGDNNVKLTSSFRDRSGNQMLLGFADGSVQQVSIEFETTFEKFNELDAKVATLFTSNQAVDELVTLENSTYRMLEGQLVRRQRVATVSFSDREPILDDQSAVLHLSALPARTLSSFDQSTETVFVAISKTQFGAGRLDTKINQFSGASSAEWTSSVEALPASSPAESIVGVMVQQFGQYATLCMKDGKLHRWQLNFGQKPQPLNNDDSLDGEAIRVTTAAVLLGDNTLLAGSNSGSIQLTFLTQQNDAPENSSANDSNQADDAESVKRKDAFVVAHRFQPSSAPIAFLGSSPGSRLFAVLDTEQKLSIAFAPTDTLLDQKIVDGMDGSQVTEIWFSSKQDYIGILTDRKLHLVGVQMGHPEASLKSFFQPVWYEGYAEPVSIWQSSSAGVDAEPKLSMLPLIFGTLKATFYSMLIAVPLSIMAAVYSSEFLSRPIRSKVKPVIELMAGIPSVVLGFIAALVLAKIFREHVFAIVLSFFTLIFSLLLAGNLWLLLPQNLYLRLERFRTLFLLCVTPIGIFSAWLIARPLEALLFGRSLIWWLDARETSSAWPGWFLLLVPLSMLVVGYLSITWISAMLRPIAARWDARPFAALMLGRFVLSALCTILVAALGASFLTAIGWDPRGSVFGSYQERNALLVGAILGFAIIPIIYTISEDALQAVPQHLRSASLGCGATAWQTTIRIVLPTAMSGLFGGVMIGFGRAVGETMVVLMAAGNTPLMDVNPFNGYRTLSATLATELPEAARGSTHFHTLFLAALLLFAFTLVANTLAEFVRMHFRKRAYQL